MAQMASGKPNINGKKFDCGTFTFENDTSNDVIINHNLGVYPEAIFVWSYNFPRSPDGKKYGMVGGMKFTNEDDSSDAGFAHVANSNYTFGVTSTAIAWSATMSTITIRTSSTYKWLSGYTYQWLAIGGDIN